MNPEDIHSLKSAIQAMSWPQFVTLVTNAGLDSSQFPSGAPPAERLYYFEQQMTVTGVTWKHVEEAMPFRRRKAAPEGRQRGTPPGPGPGPGTARDPGTERRSERITPSPTVIPESPAEAGVLSFLWSDPRQVATGVEAMGPGKATGAGAGKATVATTGTDAGAGAGAAPGTDKPLVPPSFENAIRILHLSDLHFTADTVVQMAAQAVADDIRENLTLKGRIGYLVVSGDFTNQGSREGLAKAAQFVQVLREYLNLDQSRVMLVPGNHDVVDSLEAYRRVASKAGLPKGEWVEEGKIVLQRDTKHYPERFQPFSQLLYQALTGVPYPLEAAKQHESRLFGEDGLQFLCLNSCWEIDEFNRKRASVESGALGALSREAQTQVDEALAAGRMRPGARLMRIGIWHHAIIGPDQMKNTNFVTYLQRLGMRIALHGDVHSMTRAEFLGFSPVNRVHVVGAGAFAAEAELRPESTPCIYNILELQRDFSWLRVHTRKQEARGQPWRGYSEWDRTDGEDGSLPYYEVRLT